MLPERLSRTAILFAGVVTGIAIRTLAGSRSTREISALKRSIADTEAHVAQQGRELQDKVQALELRVDEHESRFNAIPSTRDIAVVVEGLLARHMASTNERLTAQAESIEGMKAAAVQMDRLLERVLDNLEGLRPGNTT